MKNAFQGRYGNCIASAKYNSGEGQYCDEEQYRRWAAYWRWAIAPITPRPFFNQHARDQTVFWPIVLKESIASWSEETPEARSAEALCSQALLPRPPRLLADRSLEFLASQLNSSASMVSLCKSFQTGQCANGHNKFRGASLLSATSASCEDRCWPVSCVMFNNVTEKF